MRAKCGHYVTGNNPQRLAGCPDCKRCERCCACGPLCECGHERLPAPFEGYTFKQCALCLSEQAESRLPA